jgi:hypothetical protein
VIAEIGAPLTIVILLVVAAGLVAFGFTSGRFTALVMLGAAMTAALVISDVLYFGFGVNLIGYCGEPKCDPGPIPAIIAVPFLIFLCSSWLSAFVFAKTGAGRRSRSSVGFVDKKHFALRVAELSSTSVWLCVGRLRTTSELLGSLSKLGRPRLKSG